MASGEAVLLVQIRPASGDRAALDSAVNVLAGEDPRLRIAIDAGTGEATLYGGDEAYLDRIVSRLRSDFGIELAAGKPQVVYKAAITRQVSGEGRFVLHSGGRSHFAHVQVRLFPRAPDGGYVFECQVREDVVPVRFVPAIEDGIVEALNHGVSGYPLNDVRVELCDASFHETDSSPMAFRMAAAVAVRDAVAMAEPVLLEPIQVVQVLVPDVFLGSVVDDLTSRHGQIDQMDRAGDGFRIRSRAPLSRLLGYAGDLQMLTNGSAGHSIVFDHYERLDGPDPGEGGPKSTLPVPRPAGPKGSFRNVLRP